MSTSIEYKRLAERRRKKLNLQGVNTSNRCNLDLKERLEELESAGFGTRNLQEASGVNRTTLYNILTQTHKTSDWGVRANIEAMTPEQIFSSAHPESLVPSYASARRLKALCCIGWSLRTVTTMMQERGHNGLAKSVLNINRVSKQTHDIVADIYEELCMTPGTYSRGIKIARQKGWVPPLAWDRIEDYKEEPRGVSNV